MVVIAESIPSSNLMLPLVSIAHLVRWFTTDVWRTSPNRSSSCWMVTLWLQVGTPRSWFKRTISLTTWYNVILHVHAVVMIVMMQLLSLSLLFPWDLKQSSSTFQHVSSHDHLMLVFDGFVWFLCRCSPMFGKTKLRQRTHPALSDRDIPTPWRPRRLNAWVAMCFVWTLSWKMFQTSSKKY